MGGADRCDYCDGTELVYELSVRGGSKSRCIECLAIEQGQRQFSLPFETWLDQDDLDGPGIEPFDPRENDYKTLRSWFKILARIKDDDPIIKRDPDATGTVFEDTREFLINVMGAAAYYSPSEIIEAGGDPGQTTQTDGGSNE